MKTEFKNNAEARKHAKKFVDNELLAFFDKIEDGPDDEGYGSLIHCPKGKQKAEYIFFGRTCLRVIEPIKGKQNVFLRSKKF